MTGIVLRMMLLAGLFGLIGGTAQGATQSPAPVDCARICGEIRMKLKADQKSVRREYDRWMRRLSLKSDVVTYHRGESAAEELLRYIGSHYATRSRDNQMDPEFLALLMNKCFPAASVDVDHARMSGLIDTIWAAKTLRIDKRLAACR